MNNLPLELEKLILSKIIDNNVILTCRLVNKRFYDFFSPLKIYKEGIHIETIKFDNFNIYGYYPDGKIKLEFEILNLGKTRYNEFNESGMIIKSIIITPPYKIKKQTIDMNMINIVTYDINTQKETKTDLFRNPQCIIT